MKAGWNRLEKQGAGAFSYEIWYNFLEKRYWLKVFVYGKVIELSGDYDTLNKKLDEFSTMWNRMVDTIDFIHKAHETPEEEMK